MKKFNPKNSVLFLFIFLGMLTAFGPFVTDIYLPALPLMTVYFNASIPMVQLGLTFSMLGLALGQIFFGPLSDKYGRKNPLLFAMYVFAVSTIACIFSQSIEVFLILRFIQGLSAAGGIVISRSIATDKFRKQNLTKALALVAVIGGIAPIIAPIMGGLILNFTTWKGVFAALLILGVILLSFCVKFNESLSTPRKSKEKLTNFLKLFKNVLKNKKYIFYVLNFAFAQGILFGYIAASPFIIQNHYGFSPMSFGFLFAINAAATGAGAGTSAIFKKQENCVLTSACAMVFFSVIMFVTLMLNAGIVIFEINLIILLFSMGLTFTSSTALAMNINRKQAGTASSLLGATPFLFGGIVSPLAGLGNILFSTGIIFVASAILSFACALLAIRK
jgi:DHA1 family bicyclomycin/chloramphenicol resistance-like MFS transporter